MKQIYEKKTNTDKSVYLFVFCILGKRKNAIF